MHKALFIVAVTLSGAAAVHAQVPYYGGAPGAGYPSGAGYAPGGQGYAPYGYEGGRYGRTSDYRFLEFMVKDAFERMQGFLHQEDAKDQEKAREFFETQVAPYFDFNAITVKALGQSAQEMSEEGWANAVKQVKDSIFDRLMKSRDRYGFMEVRVHKAKQGRQGDVEVPVVTLTNSGILRMTLFMYPAPDGWKVAEAVVNEESLTGYVQSDLGWYTPDPHSPAMMGMGSPREGRMPMGPGMGGVPGGYPMMPGGGPGMGLPPQPGVGGYPPSRGW
jgi:hypothetical protein